MAQTCTMPELAKGSQSHHTCRSHMGGTVYLIQWRDPAHPDQWFMYGRVYCNHPADCSLTTSLATLRAWRKKKDQRHEYRVVAYNPVAIVKERA